MNVKDISCWVVTEGLAGTENQCLGVAEALGLKPEIKRVALRQPWKSLSPWLELECARTFDPPLRPPWPDILIASGRKSIAASRYIKKMSDGKAFTVQIQDPRISPAAFDLVAVPEHDRLRGENVIATRAAPNRITAARLNEAKKKFPQFGQMKPPRVAVLIGGNSKTHRMPPALMQRLCGQLKTLEAGLMVTASRRTDTANRAILEETLKGQENCYLWDGTGDNPYFGFLAWADVIVVTEDSASMISEAATTGKPVYTIEMEGQSRKFDAFYASLARSGIIRPFTGALEHWAYKPLNDAVLVADEIKSRMSRDKSLQLQ